ncbi:glycoprotein [Apiospora arundinis]
MKFSAAAVFATAASAATVYEVSDFSAACIEHSVQCFYEFGVFQPGTMQTEPQSCKASALSGVDGKLAEVGPWEGKCDQTSKTFSVAHTADGGLKLTVSAPVSPSSNTTGVYTIPASDLAMQGAPLPSDRSTLAPRPSTWSSFK